MNDELRRGVTIVHSVRVAFHRYLSFGLHFAPFQVLEAFYYVVTHWAVAQVVCAVAVLPSASELIDGLVFSLLLSSYVGWLSEIIRVQVLNQRVELAVRFRYEHHLMEG